MTPRVSPYVDFLARLERARESGVLLGLDRVRVVLDRLGNPQLRSATVHIAGTNGKGSTAAMTEAILRAAGIRTGLFTSPHLSRFTERIRVDGQEADGNLLATLDEAIVAIGIPLTYFEIATVLAFLVFARAGVEIAVIETGLGGRLDATTTCAPVATAITSIGLDHAEYLGDTLAAIAGEKAGIAKPGVPLLLAPVPPDADAAIVAVAGHASAPILRFGKDFAAAPLQPVLPGAHQDTNAALATALARIVADRIGHPLPSSAIDAGLRGVVWPGRLEWIGDTVLLDCAHNPEGARALAAALTSAAFPHPAGQQRALVFSVVSGKAPREMLEILAPCFDAVFATRSSNPRALAAHELAAHLRAMGYQAAGSIDDPLDALAAAQALIGRHGVVVVAGSTFLVGDVRAALLGEERDVLPTSDPVWRPGLATRFRWR